MSLLNCALRNVSISCRGEVGQISFDLPVEITPQSVVSVSLVEPLPPVLDGASITYEKITQKVVIADIVFVFSTFTFTYDVLTCFNSKRIRVIQKILVIPEDCSGSGSGGNQGFNGAQGRFGSQGRLGEQGRRGAQGFRGVQGRQGRSGVQGRQGKVGAQGKVGEQGVGAQGRQGKQGRLGDQGRRGLQGQLGNQGRFGGQGSLGFRGNQGFSGTGGGASSDVCAQLAQSEVAASQNFCIPCNPYAVVADPDPQSKRQACRQIALPAGTHIPCATLQAEENFRYTTTDLNMFDFANTFYLFDGCDNGFGCEFWVSASNRERVVPFAIDQTCTLLNASTGTASTPSFASIQILDIRCFKDKAYLLNNANQLFATPLNFFGPNLPLYTINTLSQLKQFVINDAYLYVSDLTTSIMVFDLATGSTLISSLVLTATLADMAIVDNIFTAIFVGDTLWQIQLNPNGSFGAASSIGLSTNSTLQTPGLVVHPVLPIVFAGTHTANSIVLQAIRLSTSGAPAVIAELPISATVIAAQALVRFRPRYCNGIIQFVSPTGRPSQSLITVRHDDYNPSILTLISNIPLPSSIAGDVDAQFLSTAGGCFVFSDVTNSGQHLYIFEPLEIEQKYINLKPMVLPGSVSAKFSTVPQEVDIGFGDIKGLKMPTFDGFVSNFADINEPSAFTVDSINIFTPQRSMLVHVDVMLRVVAGNPNSLQNWSLTVSAAFPERLTDEKTFTDVHTFHVHGDLIVAAGVPLQMQIYDPSPNLSAIGILRFALHFIRYV